MSKLRFSILFLSIFFSFSFCTFSFAETEFNEANEHNVYFSDPDFSGAMLSSADSNDITIEIAGSDELNRSTLDLPEVVLAQTKADTIAQRNGTGYNTLEEALDGAVSGDTVVLLKDYELTRDITVPSGVFLLLSCMDGDTGYDTETGFCPDGTDVAGKESKYCTLTIPQNVTMNILGKVLINSVVGRPGGGNFDQNISAGYAEIILDGTIEVGAYGMLDCCGYISGNGQVNANASSTVYDLYVVKSWRGGSQAATITLDEGIYPMNEYECRNIQVPVKIDSRATYAGTVKMYAGGGYNRTRFPQFDKNNGLVRINDGCYAIKTLDKESGRSTIDIYGGAEASHSSLNIVGTDLSTKDYLYPINGIMTFNLHNGNYVINDDFKFLTGSELNLLESSTLTINGGYREETPTTTGKRGTVVFYDEFHDVKNLVNTEYPERPAAKFELYAGAAVTVDSGCDFSADITGSPECSAASPAKVVISDGAVLDVTTKEANGYRPSATSGPDSVKLNFDTEFIFADSTKHLGTKAGEYLYSGTVWSGGDIVQTGSDGQLTGMVTLDGNKSNEGVSVTLSNSENNYTAVTDADGRYKFSNIEYGSYILNIQKLNFLNYRKSAIVISNSDIVNISEVVLNGGDLNSDGKVTSSDLSILLGNYQKSIDIGDINGDGMVTSADLSILLANYQRSAIAE